MGGIVTTTVPYATQAALPAIYAPGEVFLGRYWDGLNASNPISGSWSQTNAFRTIVHEWGHYALFLYDKYQAHTSTGRVETYCTRNDLPQVSGAEANLAASAMAFHYTASELWASDVTTPSACLNTAQLAMHGKTDWQTLNRWASIQGLPTDWLAAPVSTSVNFGPASDRIGDLFGRHLYTYDLPFIGKAIPSVPSLSEPAVRVTLSSSLSNTNTLNSLYPQVYVTENLNSISRLLYHGTTSGTRSLAMRDLGGITLLGIRADTRARVFVDRYSMGGVTGGRYVYQSPAGPDPLLSNGQTLQATPSTWTASLDVAYGVTDSRVTTMTVTLVSPQALATAPTIQLCVPAAEIGCPNDPAWRKTMQAVGSITWTAALTAGGEIPGYGLLRVQTANLGELIRWYQQAGGVGPAHIPGNAPRRDGVAMVDSLLLLSGKSHVIFMPAG